MRRLLGATDVQVSPLGYGCDKLAWTPGRDPNSYMSSLFDIVEATPDLGEEDFIKADFVVGTAFDVGINLFDVADFYGGGRSERALGEAVRRSPYSRDAYVLQTKCGLRPRVVAGKRVVTFDLSFDHIVNSVEGSLRRLQTDYIDILLLHAVDLLADPLEIARALELLYEKGMVRHFGVSNHGIGALEVLSKYVTRPLIVNQCQLGIANSSSIAATQSTSSFSLVDYCQSRGIQLQAFSPLRGAHHLAAPSMLAPEEGMSAAVNHASSLLASVARKNEVATSAIALAWLMRHPASIIPIVGSTQPERIREAARAPEVRLSPDEWYGLFQAFKAAQLESPAV